MKLECCTCGQQVHVLNSKNLFDDDGNEIVQNLQTLTGQLITHQEDMPENICISCLLQLNNALAFRGQCLRMFQKLSILHTTSITEEKDEINLRSRSSLEDLDTDTPESDYIMVYQDGKREVTMEIKPLNYHPAETHQIADIDNTIDDSEIKLLDDFQYANDEDGAVSQSGQISAPLQLKNKSITYIKKQQSKPKQSKQVRSRVKGRFFCEKCFKCFSDKSNLNVHMKRHDEKKFECAECGRKEFTQHLVNLHVRIKHNGELPYVCKFCGKRFDNSLKRLRHERVIHIKYDYPRNHICSICNKSFMDKATLKFHEVVHSGEQPFRCDLCNVNFNRKTSLSTHFRSKTHKNKEQQDQRDKDLNREQKECSS